MRAVAADRAAAALAANHLVEICGEPWIGKTRLLHQVMDAAGRRGWSVAHAAAGPPGDALPFQLFSDAFEDVLAERGPEVLDTVPNVHRSVLGALFPALDARGRHDHSPVPRPEPVARALRDLIPALAAPPGLLLALDNVHWSDPTSLDLLESLLRRPPAARFLVAVAHRERQSPPRLRGLLACVRDPHRVRLEPLPEAELTALLPAAPTWPQRRSLLDQAGGNPGLLLALSAAAEAVAERGGVPAMDCFAPHLEEFRAVSDDGWLVAQSAAVLRDGFTLAEVRRLTRLGDDRFVDAFDELVREDILRPAEVPGTYRFRHQLLGSAAYYSAGEGRRLAAHAAAVEVVRVPTSCAHPVAGTGLCPSWTGDRVRSGLLPDVTAPFAGDEAWLHDQRIRTGKALVIAGRPVEALDVLDRTVHAGAAASAVARAKAAEWQARAHRLTGRHAVAEMRLDAVRKELGDEPEANALVELAMLASALERGRPPRGAESRAVRWAIDQSDPLARAYALALLAAWDADTGRVGRAADRIRAVTCLLHGMDDAHLIGRLEVLYWTARAQARLEQDRDAVQHLDRGLGIAEAHELEYLTPRFATGLAAASLRLGRLEQATDAGRRAVRAADRIGGGYLAAEAQAVLCRAAWISGDRTTASDAARRAVEHAAAWREPWSDGVRLAVLETTLDIGDPKLCKGILSARTLKRVAAFPVVAQVPAIGETLARVESAPSGPGTGGARWAEAAEDAAGQMRLPGAIGLALLARAHHHRNTDPLASAVFAASAVVALTRAGRLIDAARAHLSAAAAWTALADTTEADCQLSEAQTLLDRCGAHGYLEQAAGLTAPNSPQAADTRLTVLSGRETEIAVLVSDGYTNQQIARALRVSHKTVETHLSRIFKKLKVTSRAQVATSIGRSTRAWTPRMGGGRLARRGQG